MSVRLALAWLRTHGCVVRQCHARRIEIARPPVPACEALGETHLRIELGPAGTRRELIAAPLHGCTVVWSARDELPPCVGARLRDELLARLATPHLEHSSD